jgi:hypothetical protein
LFVSPNIFASAAALDISTRVSSAACRENYMLQCTQSGRWRANSKEKLICCVAIPPGAGTDAHLPTQMHIFQRNSACATLKTFLAQRNKLRQCRKSVC